MTAATIIAVAAACIGLLALLASVLVLRKVRAHQQMLEREIERGRGAFDEVVAHEVQQRAVELQQALARQRADSLSHLAEEERKIADERRRDVLERERDAGARLGEQLTEVQRSVEQRLTDWASDVEQLQEGLNAELRRIEARQRQLMTETEAKIGKAAEGVQGQVEEQRQLLARLRSELSGTAQQLMQSANAELEQHAAERRRALHEVAERLRKRERDLHEIAEREANDAAQRVQISIGDVERRQVEQLQRIVGRETQRFAESTAQQFDTQIKTAREEAARRLSRELDLAVERFSREAEGVLTERLNHVSDAAAARVEERLARLRSGLERQRDDALQSLEDRAHHVEASLRERLHEIATDAESERAILDARLHDLARRLDELATRA
ncbi:MAG TPA: hypothetical protein VGO39_02015 [Gaiellaceae bacterium]|jgi:hypothetical protein|nr:hypothetical protein [Gaiellaceae bacterium]